MESTFTAPDGQQFTVTVPDGTPREDAQRYAEEEYAKFTRTAPMYSDEMYTNPMRRFAVGVAEGTGVPAAAELIGTRGVKDWINRYQRESHNAMLRGGERVDLAGGLGQAVGFLGTGMGLGAITKGSAAAAKVADAIAGSKFRQYVAGGALAGAMTPMENEGDSPWTTKAEQIAGGAAMGAITKAGVAGVTGAGKWVGAKTGQLVDAYLRDPEKAATKVLRQVGQELLSPAERAAVTTALNDAATDPRYANMTSEQILREKGLGATLIKLLEGERLTSSPTHAAYVDQERALLEAPRTWLEGIRGPHDFLAQEAADKAALSTAFESAKTEPVLLNIKPVMAELKRKLAPTTSKVTKVAPGTGIPIPSAHGKSIMTEGGEPISPAFRKELQGIQARLYQTDTPKLFMERVQRLAEQELPTSGGIKAKGYANKLREIIGAIGKAEDLAPIQTQLDELVASIKQAGMGVDEIGRAAKAIRSAVSAGPARLTDNAATILNVRSQILKQADENPSAFEAGQLRDLVGLIDKAGAKEVPALAAAMAQRVTAGEQLNRRKVAGALVDAMRDPTGQYTPEKVLAAFADPDFVQRTTKGVQPIKETLGKYFSPAELQQLEQAARVSRGVGAYTPKVTERGAETVAGRIEVESPHVFSRIASILAQAGRLGSKKLEEPIQAELLKGQLDPARLAGLLRDVPPTTRQQVIDAILANQTLAQTGRTATARAVAGQY